MTRPWKARVIRRRTILRSKFFHVVEEDVALRGRRFPYQFRPFGNVAHIVALTRRREAVLVRQYRHPVRRSLLELPAGKIERGESALAGAKRELLEETGYAARRWIALGRWYPSPASTNMKSCYFLALDARRARRAAPEDTEFLRVELHPFRELLARVQRLPDSPVGLHLGILLAGLRLGVLHAGHAIDVLVSMKTRSIPE